MIHTSLVRVCMYGDMKLLGQHPPTTSLSFHTTLPQFRAFMQTDTSKPVLPNWANVETASVSDPSFITATSTCGCTPTNPSGQPVDLSIRQQGGAVEFRCVRSRKRVYMEVSTRSCGCASANQVVGARAYAPQPQPLPTTANREDRLGNLTTLPTTPCLSHPMPPPPLHSWVVGSACESSVSITRSLVDEVNNELLNTTTVAQLSIGLACGTAYRPSKAEVDEDIARDKLQVRVPACVCGALLDGMTACRELKG